MTTATDAPERFSGQTAIVTGSSHGIGLAVARRLVGEGANVVLTGRHQDALDQAVEELGGAAHAHAVRGEADDPDHQAVTVGRALEVFGSVDLLVNNVGINPGMARLMDIDVADLRCAVEVNALAALGWVIQGHEAWMRAHGGAIVNISSFAASQPIPGLGTYGVSKAVLAHLTGQLAVELGPNVRVNAVTPAVVKTRFAARRYEGREAEVAQGYPLKRLGLPTDIARVVAFLLSQEAGWITGQNLFVDGGKSLTGTVGAVEDPSSALSAVGQVARV